jgi:hemolysin D
MFNKVELLKWSSNDKLIVFIMKKIDRYDRLAEDQNHHHKIKILIVDDQNFVRNFLQHILETEPNFQIVGTANNGQDAIKKVASLKPNLVLIDLEMPEMDGLTATGIIARKYPQCKILILTSHKDSEHLQKALHAGANGYILKDCSPKEIFHAVYSVERGYTQLSPGLLEKVLIPQIKIVPEAQREGMTQLEFSFIPESTTEVNQKSHLRFLKSLVPFLLITTTILIPLSILTKVDRVVTIQGKLVATEKTIDLNAPIDGTIINLEVETGEKVTQGQTLIQIESSSINDQLKQGQEKLINLQNQLANLDFFKKQQLLSIRNQQQENKARELEQQLISKQLLQNLATLQASHNDYLAEKSAQLAKSYQEIAKAKSAYQFAEMHLDLAQKKVARFNQSDTTEANQKTHILKAEKTLQSSKIAFDRSALTMERVTYDYNQKHDLYKQLQQKLNAEIWQVKSKIQAQEKSDRVLIDERNSAISSNQESLKETEIKIVAIQQEIARNNSLIKNLKSQLPKQNLSSPIDGIVYQISVKKPGVTVIKKQALVRIAPETSSLIFQGKISDRDSHLLEIGLPVKLNIKSDRFDKTKTIPGRLSRISDRAKTSNNSPQKPAIINNSKIEIQLKQNYIQSQKQQVFLTPEATVTAEIILKERSIITLLWDWLKGK